MKLKGIIVGGQEAWKAADDLKKNNISVIYTISYALPCRTTILRLSFRSSVQDAGRGSKIQYFDRRRRTGSA